MPSNFKMIEFILKKYGKTYPNLVSDDYCISLYVLGDMLNTYNIFEKLNDFDSIRLLGLTDIKRDCKIITGDIKEIRKLKLERILNEKV